MEGNPNINPINERLQEKYYLDFLDNENKVENLLHDMEQVYLLNPDRGQAEKIILDTIADKITEAIENSKLALEKWLTELKK